jgi:hypothetical protein
MTLPLAPWARAWSEGLVPTLHDEHRAGDHASVFTTSPRRGQGSPLATPSVSVLVSSIKSRSRRTSTRSGADAWRAADP